MEKWFSNRSDERPIKSRADQAQRNPFSAHRPAFSRAPDPRNAKPQSRSSPRHRNLVLLPILLLRLLRHPTIRRSWLSLLRPVVIPALSLLQEKVRFQISQRTSAARSVLEFVPTQLLPGASLTCPTCPPRSSCRSSGIDDRRSARSRPRVARNTRLRHQSRESWRPCDPFATTCFPPPPTSGCQWAR